MASGEKGNDMNQTKRDLLNIFFRRDSLRERIYPTRVTYLSIVVVVMIGAALLLAGTARFSEALGLKPLSPAATTARPSYQASSESPPAIQATRVQSSTAMGTGQENATPGTAVPVPSALASSAPANSSIRCPITWHVQEAAKQGGGRIGLPDDDQVAARARQDFREAMQWANAPTQAWNLTQVDRYYTSRMADDVRAAVQLSLNRQEYVQVELTDLGFVSMSFTPDGAGVTFMSVQYEPITQTVRDVSTQAAKRTVVLNDVPYRLVGIAMLYDTQACRWKIDEVDYPEPVKTP